MADQLPAAEDLDRLPTDKELARLQRTTVLYYLHETNPDNGLVRDKTDPTRRAASPPSAWPWRRSRSSSSAACSFRKFAAKIARRRLRSLLDLPQGPEPDAAGLQGASSTTSSTSKPAAASGSASCPRSTRRSCSPGALTCATYFDGDTEDEAEVRRLADALYRRADWNWALDGGPTLTHGWKPETGFMPAPLPGLRRGALALHPRPRLADSPLAAGELRRLLRHLPVEGNLRPRAALLRAALHPPTLAPVDRLPRHSRRVHARARQRLLREQPAGDLRAAGVRRPEPAGLRGLRGALLGVHGLRWPRAGSSAR